MFQEPVSGTVCMLAPRFGSVIRAMMVFLQGAVRLSQRPQTRATKGCSAAAMLQASAGALKRAQTGTAPAGEDRRAGGARTSGERAWASIRKASVWSAPDSRSGLFLTAF